MNLWIGVGVVVVIVAIWLWVRGEADQADQAEPVTAPAPAPPVIAAGVASMTGSGGMGRRPGRAKEIEAAMSQAILDAMAAGITDPAVIRRAQLDARDRVLRG